MLGADLKRIEFSCAVLEMKGQRVNLAALGADFGDVAVGGLRSSLRFNELRNWVQANRIMRTIPLHY